MSLLINNFSFWRKKRGGPKWKGNMSNSSCLWVTVFQYIFSFWVFFWWKKIRVPEFHYQEYRLTSILLNKGKANYVLIKCEGTVYTVKMKSEERGFQHCTQDVFSS